MSVAGNGPYPPHDGGQRDRLQKAQANERRRSQPAASKIHVAGCDRFIETHYLLVKLCTHSADQPIAKSRQLAQRNRRARFGSAISLPELEENNRPFPHGW